MQTAVKLTELYDLLSQKIGKEQAKSLVEYVETKVDSSIEEKVTILATKEDLERGFKEHARWMLSIFITLVIMILGLYATILFRK